jgi:cytochrome c551/c552
MWNHAPRMFAAMKVEGIERREMTEQNAADLFAYFYSAGFFERPGDAGRGKALLAAKGCAECHSGQGPGKVVSEWRSSTDPIVLATEMWNHIGYMDEALAKRNKQRPALTSQEIRDLSVYIQTLPQNRSRLPEFALAPPASGERIFREKGCLECHQGQNSLDRKLSGFTVTDIMAAMWNHGTKMVRMQPGLGHEEMRQLLSYLWAGQFLDGSGNTQRGQRVFNEKKCAACHDGSKAPQMPKAGSSFNSSQAIAALWKHGQQMMEMMNRQSIAWPQFKAGEMADLVAFLNNKPSGR